MEAVPINTLATFVGWGLQRPISKGIVTQLKGINVTVIECQHDDISWISKTWGNGKSIFICTEKTAGGGCEGDAGGASALEDFDFKLN